MICQDCKNGYHEGCRGKTWCPCQHRVPDEEQEHSAEWEALQELTQLAQEMEL